MIKTAISLTLQAENLTWLKARARSGEARSISEALDRLVTEARARRGGADARSVVGTIDVDPADPMLLNADDAIRSLVARSVGRPFVVKETRPAYGTRARRRRG